jgi:hypothetical protein
MVPARLGKIKAMLRGDREKKEPQISEIDLERYRDPPMNWSLLYEVRIEKQMLPGNLIVIFSQRSPRSLR